MSRLEEESTKNHVVVDRFEARFNHFKTLVFSLLVVAVYTAYLWFVCSTRPTMTSSLLLFGSQIALGFSATRAYYEWGLSNKNKLHFLDPAKMNGKGKHLEIEIHQGDLPLLFETMQFKVSKFDKGSFDDFNDLAWFSIFVWAALSSSLFYLNLIGNPICFGGSLVLLLSCIGSYLSGYWKDRNQSFEDDLSHLQYYVEKHYKTLNNHLPKNSFRMYVQMMEQWRTKTLLDFSVEVPLGNNNALEYHMGLPSSEKERIVIKSEEPVLDRIYHGATQLPDVIKHGWIVERILTPSGPIVRILNQSSDFSLLNRFSYIKSPSLIDESSIIVGTIFSNVVKLSK